MTIDPASRDLRGDPARTSKSSGHRPEKRSGAGSVRGDHIDTIATFYDAITSQRDPYEGSHSADVARLTELTASLLKFPKRELPLLKVAAHLHDVGKVGLPETVLNKPGRYTRSERIMVQSHTIIGVALLRPFRLGPIINDVILHHHERMDGQGYPHHLRGQALSPHAQIVRLADVYDALTNERPYRRPLPSSDAIQMILDDKDASSPQVLEAFLEALKLYANDPALGDLRGVPAPTYQGKKVRGE